MCGRYAFFDPGDFSQRFLVDEGQLDYTANYNISPGSYAPVVTRNSPNRVKNMKWGLIPSWSKEFKMSYSTFNARLETIAQKPTYRQLLMKRRCLIPANGFYEWTENNGKTPHYIFTTDQKIFAFAGLYDVWTDAEGKDFYTFTIITTGANLFMKPIHHRMPVILTRDHEDIWLNHAITDIKKVMAVLSQYSPNHMTKHQVSRAVNKAGINSPDCIKPVD